MSHPLDGAREKVARGQSHLDALQEKIAAYSQGEPFRFEGEMEDDTGHLVFRVRFGKTPELPVELALIAGDAVHNLRTALDHLAWALAESGTGPGPGTQFPILDSRNAYAARANSLLEGIGQEFRARIERLQPYRVRELVELGQPSEEILAEYPHNTNLFLIGRLDNMDKHRLLLKSVPLLAFRPPVLTNVLEASGTVPGPWIQLDEDGKEIYRITDLVGIDPNEPVLITEHPPWTAIFGNPTYDRAELWGNRRYGAGSPSDLQRAADSVSAVIDSFADAFAADPEPAE